MKDAEDAPAAPARPAGDAGVTRLPRLALRVWQATTCATALPIAAVLAAVALWWDHPVGGPVLWILVALTAAVALADLAVVNRVRKITAIRARRRLFSQNWVSCSTEDLTLTPPLFSPHRFVRILASLCPSDQFLDL